LFSSVFVCEDSLKLSAKKELPVGEELLDVSAEVVQYAVLACRLPSREVEEIAVVLMGRVKRS